MLLTSLETAQRLEEADVLHLTHQVRACQKLFPDQNVKIGAVGQGVAAITLASFGRKLNHIVGMGMSGPVSTEDFANIENLYVKMGIDCEIDLCSHAHDSVLPILAARGYTANGWINTYVLRLTDEDSNENEVEVPGVKILRLNSETAHGFPAITLVGMKSNGRSELLLKSLGQIAVLREDTSLYFAMVEGKIAGSAALALIETSKGGVAHLYIDSTIPEYRGRGVQLALLRARLADARRAGYDLASVGVRPANGSSRNIERAGFSLAYTKATFVKKLG